MGWLNRARREVLQRDTGHVVLYARPKPPRNDRCVLPRELGSSDVPGVAETQDHGNSRDTRALRLQLPEHRDQCPGGQFRMALQASQLLPSQLDVSSDQSTIV